MIVVCQQNVAPSEEQEPDSPAHATGLCRSHPQNGLTCGSWEGAEVINCSASSCNRISRALL